MDVETDSVSTEPVEASSEPVEATQGAPAAQLTEETPKAEEGKPAAEAWAKLRRAEERARREREEAKAEAKRVAEERAQIEALKAEAEELRRKVSLDAYDDPLQWLEATGVDYDDLTRRILSQPPAKAKPSREVEELRAKLDKLEAEREAERKAAEERAQAGAWSQVVSAFEEQIAPPAEGEHAFELLHAEWSADRAGVEATLREMAEQQPELSVAEAAELYEKFIVEQTKRRLGAKKLRAMMSAEADPKQSTTATRQAPTGSQASEGGPRTLSHVDSSERATDVATSKPLHEMTLYERRQWEKESEARAAKALEDLWRSRSA